MWKLLQYSFLFSDAAAGKTLHALIWALWATNAAATAAAIRRFRFHGFFLRFLEVSLFAVRCRDWSFRCSFSMMWGKPKEAPVVCLRATWTKYAPNRLALALCSRCLASAWCTPITECIRCGGSCYRHFIICNLPSHRFTATFFSSTVVLSFLSCLKIACLTLVKLPPKFKQASLTAKFQ